MRRTEIERIARQLTKVYNGHPWHGPSLLSVLKQVSPETAAWRIGSGHSVVELVAHMTSWRRFVTERLRGNDAFDISDAENFPPAEAWRAVHAAFEATQPELLAVVQSFPEARLDDLVADRKYTYYSLLHGVIEHDIYHLGQIVFVLKSR